MIRRRLFLRTVTAFVFSVLLLVPPYQAAETLPAQLTDSEFWQLIVDYSEDGGTFPSENFLSNERAYQSVIPELQSSTTRGGVYLGVGPEQNFTYIAGVRPKMAFIVDIRRQNMIQHLMYKAAFEMSSDRADFLAVLFSRKKPAGLEAEASPEVLFSAFDSIPPDPVLFGKTLAAIQDRLVKDHKFALTPGDLDTMAHVLGVFALYGPDLNYSAKNALRAAPPRPDRPEGPEDLSTADAEMMSELWNQFKVLNVGMPSYAELMSLDDERGVQRSYLATEENFRFVKDLEARNLIVPVVGDFGGPKALRSVGRFLKDHEAVVTAFYVSNVEQYLFLTQVPNGVGGIMTAAHNFYANVAELPLDASSTFIRSGNGSNSPVVVGRVQLRSLLSPIIDSVKAFQAGEVVQFLDLLELSH